MGRTIYADRYRISLSRIKKAILSDGFDTIVKFNYFTFTSSTSKTNHEFGGITPPAPLSP